MAPPVRRPAHQRPLSCGAAQGTGGPPGEIRRLPSRRRQPPPHRNRPSGWPSRAAAQATIRAWMVRFTSVPTWDPLPLRISRPSKLGQTSTVVIKSDGIGLMLLAADNCMIRRHGAEAPSDGAGRACDGKVNRGAHRGPTSTANLHRRYTGPLGSGAHHGVHERRTGVHGRRDLCDVTLGQRPSPVASATAGGKEGTRTCTPIPTRSRA